MKDKFEILVNHWSLVPIFFISIFGFSYQAIPILSWLYIPLVLNYTRYEGKRRIGYVATTCFFGLFTAFAGTFRGSLDGPRFPNVGANLFFSALVLSCVLTMLFAERFVLKHTHQRWIRVLFFPTFWTAIWVLFTLYVGIGDFILFSVALVNWSDFAQIASLGGRHLLDFTLALFGTVILELPTFPIEALFTVSGPTTTPSKKSAYLTLLSHPVTQFTIAISLAVVYGGASVNIRQDSLYQKSYVEFLPKLEPVGCVVGPGLDFPDLQKQQDIWLDKSLTLVESGAKLILWSELTTFVNTTEDEVALIEKATEFASKHQVYFGLAYGRLLPVQVNKLVFILKNGTIGFDYNKAHPVPGVEPQPPGPNVLQYVDTEDFGRVGGAICFDYNFPDLISQSSKHKVDIMLQPSWTWGPIGTYHEQSNILRAVENGFTLFRCVSEGVSGIFEPTLNSMYNQKVASLTVQEYLFYLPIQKRVTTLYGYIGNTLNLSFIIGSFGILSYVIYLKKRGSQISIE